MTGKEEEEHHPEEDGDADNDAGSDGFPDPTSEDVDMAPAAADEESADVDAALLASLIEGGCCCAPSNPGHSGPRRRPSLDRRAAACISHGASCLLLQR